MTADWPDADTYLRAMARRYVWDQSEAEAMASPDRIIRRVMDLGTIDDAFDLEPISAATASPRCCAPRPPARYARAPGRFGTTGSG